MAALLPLICALAAISVDVGYLCATDAQLQNAADAGANAAVMEIWNARADAADEYTARSAAADEAKYVAGLNHRGAATKVQFGSWDEHTFTQTDNWTAANAVKVTCSRNDVAAAGPCRTVFACVFGLNTVEEHGVAVARFRPVGLSPFSIYEDDVVEPGQTLTLYDDVDPVTPGIFGMLDLNGGGNSARELIDWIDNGYDGPFYCDPETGYIDVEGNPGWVDAIKPSMQQHINLGDSVIACVYSSVWDMGANTTFRVVGFIEVVITAMGHDKNEDGTMRKWFDAEVQAEYIPGTGLTHGTMEGFMKLQLVQ